MYDQQMQDRFRRYQIHDAEFQNHYIPDAKYVHDKILDRLTLQQRDTLVSHNGEAEAILSSGRQVGAMSGYGVAGYVDELAHTLCSKP